MTDIIFHIGFGKCASTTLQNFVFPQTKGYFGGGKKVAPRYRYAKKFQYLSPCGPRLWGNMKQASKWADEVRSIKQSDFPEVDRLIVSSESFITKNLLNNRPIINFLKKFQNKIWKEGEIKIVIVIRNQPDKIASSYSQISYRFPAASQKHFRDYVNEFIKDHYENMNYADWLEDLFLTFGEKNICVLLMEDIKTLYFWKKLKEFTDLVDFDPYKMVDSSEVFNKRKSSDNSWLLRDYDPYLHSAVQVGNIFGFFWPNYFNTDVRNKLVRRLCTFISKRYRKKYLTKKVERGREIYLSPAIKDDISKAYSRSNDKLSELLNRDLKSLGYL